MCSLCVALLEKRVAGLIVNLYHKAMIQRQCRFCSAQFTIALDDDQFYNKLAVPAPTLCPGCRLQRRLAWRNERTLYTRTCSLCTRSIVAVFGADAPFPVYCTACWWSDKWDPATYAQEIDWSRPFFEQFGELLRRVPKAAALQLNNENCEYNALIAYSKNTYMSPGCYCAEDCYYVRKSQYSKDCINSNALDHCELVADSTNCRNCVDSSYLADCSGCTNCFMCSGLTNKKFCFKNQQLTEAEYQAKVSEYVSKPAAAVLAEFLEFNRTIPKRYQNQLKCEASDGDYLYDSYQAKDCYDCFDIQNSKYLVECVDVKDSMDLSLHDKNIQLCYELCSGGESNYNTKFSYCVIAATNSDYLYACFYLTDSFGCDGFHSRAANYILNKKYSPEDYIAIRARLIDHMRETKEYGEFMPMSIAPVAYNESLAQDYFPLTADLAKAKGYAWKESTDVAAKQSTAATKTCAHCSKSYRIILQEQQRYQQLGLTEPTLCPNCRFQQLLSWKNPRQLWHRQCMCLEPGHNHAQRCVVEFETTYAPERPEQVYCEECYRQMKY